MKINYNHFLFDLDGTLVNSMEEIFKAAKSTCERNNLKIPNYEYFKTRVGMHPAIFFEDHGAIENIDILIKEFREILFNEAGDKSLVFEGVHELLQLIKKDNSRISLATTKPTFLARKLIPKYGLKNYFSHIQGTENNIRPKPSPDIILKCLSLSKFTNAVMIGDTTSDMLAAQAAGIDCIGVCTGANNRNKLENSPAKIVVETLTELLTLI